MNLDTRAFLGGLGSAPFPEVFPQGSHPPQPYDLRGRTHHVQWVCDAYLPAPPTHLKRFTGGAGILTSCPSGSPFGYALGPPNPTPINVA